MTDDLCSRDAYLTTCDATVTAVGDDGVTLDRTVFYARGGGQPGDTGVLRWDGGEATVADTVKSRETGEITHVLADGATAPPVGTAVTAEIDWDRRHMLMRTHTALHALSGIIFTDHGARVTGGNMDDQGSARMDFELDSMSQEFGQQVEEQLNRRLAEDVPVHVQLPAARRGPRRPRPDPHEGLADPGVGRPDPRDRHRGHRQAGRRRHPCAFDRRGRPRASGQDRVQGQSQQAHAHPARGRAAPSRRARAATTATISTPTAPPTVSIRRSCFGIGERPNAK